VKKRLGDSRVWGGERLGRADGLELISINACPRFVVKWRLINSYLPHLLQPMCAEGM
jgi:hypothetical protein